MNRRYQVVSLFSGAGGMDSGFSLSNAFRTIMANDINLSTGKHFCQELWR